MSLNKEARTAVAEQLMKVASLLEKAKKARNSHRSRFARLQNSLKQGKHQRKFADLLSEEQTLILEADPREVKQVPKDIDKAQRGIADSYNALERLETRVKTKLGLPEDSPSVQQMDRIIDAVVDIGYEIDKLYALVPGREPSPAFPTEVEEEQEIRIRPETEGMPQVELFR